MSLIFYFRPLLLILMIFSIGCQSYPTASLPSNKTEAPLPAHWQASGRIGVFTKEHGGSLGFQLEQHADHYQLRFLTPSGGQPARLEGDPTQVTLIQENGHREVAKTAEALLKKHLGWSVPLEGLRYWILGQVAPQRPVAEKILAPDGTLSYFKQLGWTISLEAYRQQGAYLLPSRLTLLYPQLKVKIAISTWIPL